MGKHFIRIRAIQDIPVPPSCISHIKTTPYIRSHPPTHILTEELPHPITRLPIIIFTGSKKHLKGDVCTAALGYGSDDIVHPASYLGRGIPVECSLDATLVGEDDELVALVVELFDFRGDGVVEEEPVVDI
jgi:hypothetical protein